MSAGSSSSPSLALPLKEVPSDYHLPIIGDVKLGFDYFNQGPDEYFRTKVRKFKSTVFETYLPPGPFTIDHRKVIVVLDAISFPVLFDTSKIDKKIIPNALLCYAPYTGRYRVCAHRDPSDPKHSLLKRLISSVLQARHTNSIPLFGGCLSELFNNLEDEISDKGSADFISLNDTLCFDFVFQLFCERKPSQTQIGSRGPELVMDWQHYNVSPVISGSISRSTQVSEFAKFIGPWLDRAPSSVGQFAYNKFYNAFKVSAKSILDEAEKMGIKRDEACHNLVYFACSNAYGGFKAWFPVLIKWVGLAGHELHKELACEIRIAVTSNGGINLNSLDELTLTESVIFEAFRIEPPFPFQHGTTKEDVVVESHEARFKINKGRVIMGYQPLATKDAKVFKDADKFVAHRFVGEEGKKLLKYVYWSNGRETDNPTTENKQCQGKDLVLMLSKIMLVEFFLRYDTFTIDVNGGPLCMRTPWVTIKSLTRARIF